MQIYIPTPYPLYATAQQLKPEHNTKQAINYSVLIAAIADHRHPWHNHAIVHMWKDYIPFIKYLQTTSISILSSTLPALLAPEIEIPKWWGDDKVHSSHRAALLRKDPKYYYSKFGWTDKPSTPLFWP